VIAAAGAGGADARAATLPAGFSDEPVATVAAPTAFAFTPDGRMLVTTKPGAVRVVTAAGALLATPALDLAAKTCANRDRGLLGVAVDPAFASNHFIYLYYTFNKFDNSCPVIPPATATGPVNRVSRFTLADTNVVAPPSETVLLDNIPSPGGDHNAGDLQFGKDANLYVTVGDGGCDYAGGGCAANNDASRDEQVLLGKVLRITASGAIPADNPYASDPNAARCNLTGQTTLLARCRETIARG
jgi:glucose/arabinose dehydrogenase